ncbi:MAG TPA: hypothetical protein VF456_21295 [Vicinamibacterales bacterium]
MTVFKRLVVAMFGVAALSAAPNTVGAAADAAEFRGVITDDNCDNGDHSHMKMGDTDAECTVACINAHGASYVLFDGKTAYTLSDQKSPEKFAGKKVKVVGSLDAGKKIIQVSSISQQ